MYSSSGLPPKCFTFIDSIVHVINVVFFSFLFTSFDHTSYLCNLQVSIYKDKFYTCFCAQETLFTCIFPRRNCRSMQVSAQSNVNSLHVSV